MVAEVANGNSSHRETEGLLPKRSPTASARWTVDYGWQPSELPAYLRSKKRGVMFAAIADLLSLLSATYAVIAKRSMGVGGVATHPITASTTFKVAR